MNIQTSKQPVNIQTTKFLQRQSYILNLQLRRLRFATWLVVKAPDPMCSTESGMVKFTNDPQLEKANSPMWVTEPGMVKVAKELQPRKAQSPM